jgi:TPR repeat protein
MGTLQPSPAVPTAPPTTGPATTETDTSGSTFAPVVPAADATLSAPEIAVLLTSGDKSFSSGDVASARLYYGRAVNAGDGQAALRLGETFDPVFLEHAHLRNVRGDLPAALSWYRRARAMGAAEAEVLLNSLEAKQGQ